jgi:hypothetical protein
MIIPKYCSIKEIFENVFRSTGQQVDITPDDATYWVYEVLQLIGYPLQYIPKVTGSKQDPVYDFTDYKIPLPCDFYKLIPGGISLNGNPVRWRTNSFHYLLDGDCCDVDSLNNTTVDVFTDNFGNSFSPEAISETNSVTVPDRYWDVTFDINDNWITFNVKEGKVCLAYYSYPLDNEGFLMIPDDAKYKRAITNYLVWKQDYILFRQGVIPDKVYQESKAECNWAIASVAAHVKMPDVDQMQSMFNSIIRLLPHNSEYQKFFQGMGLRESRPLR